MKLFFLLMAVLAGSAYGAIPAFDDDFESQYAEGDRFTAVTNGWQASGTTAYVTNGIGYTNSKAAFLGTSVTLTNTLGASADATLKVWTDFRLKPLPGVEVLTPQTNASSFLCYVRSNGVLHVAIPGGWYVCTNDVWGNTVAPLAHDAYARISVFQDYSTSNQAVMINDQLVAQDLHFVGTPGVYSKLVIHNTDSNCLLDNVWIHTNVTGLASNRNSDAESLPDAQELQRYGYARRTLYVGGAGTPRYATLQAAVDAWRLRDSIYIYAGTYAESVTITNNVVFEGQAFTVNNLTIATGAAVTFAQTFTCLGTLALTGQVAMASGASVTSVTAHVVGRLSVSGSGALVVTSLEVGAAGQVNFTNAQLVASAAGVVMTGTFAISNTWGTAASMALPFSDDFDLLYTENTVVTNLNFRGWYASSGTVKIQSAIAHTGKAVVLPDGTVLSNSINTAATKIWTDTYIRPSLGNAPPAPATNTSSFLAYANTNGYLVVATAGGGWTICSNQLNHTLAMPLRSNAFTRVTICQDLTAEANTFAVFVAGNLVAQGLSSPKNLNRYSSFVSGIGNGTAYVDDVLITTAIPPGLTSDLDRDGLVDAYEINNYGLTTLHANNGTIYKFR